MRGLLLAAPLCLALSWVWLGAKSPKPGPDGRITTEGIGYGKTESEATDAALQNAIDHFLSQERPRLTWFRTEDYLRQHAIQSKPAVKEIEPIADQRYKATMTIDVTSADYRELIERDRATRAAERHTLLLPGFIGLVLLLGGVGLLYRFKKAV
jgi:hypothetical protein